MNCREIAVFLSIQPLGTDMANSEIPFPDGLTTGCVEYDSVPSLLPGDEIEVRNEDDEERLHKYEILSIRNNERPYVRDHVEEEFKMFEKNEMREVLENENSYHWAVLNRETIPVDDHPTDTLVVWTFAVENPHAGDRRGLFFCWSITNQRPVQDMPELDGFIMGANFEMLRESIRNAEGDLSELYDTLSGSTPEILDTLAIVAEFNAESRFNLHTEPTYGDEMRRRMERDAETLGDAIEMSENVYV